MWYSVNRGLALVKLLQYIPQYILKYRNISLYENYIQFTAPLINQYKLTVRKIMVSLNKVMNQNINQLTKQYKVHVSQLM